MNKQVGALQIGAPPYFLYLGLGLLLAAFVTALFPCLRILVVAVERQDILALPADYVDEVVYSYLHSVERTRVAEFFKVEGDELRLVKAELASLGAGLPATEKAGFAYVDGRFVVTMDRLLREVPLLLDPATLPRVAVNGEPLDLSVYPLGTDAKIKVVRRPLIWLLLRRITLERCNKDYRSNAAGRRER